MLVLTRRVGEGVRIGDEIEVVVVAVRGDQVRVGIRAPREVPVVRGELLEQVERENLAAAESAVLGRSIGAALREPGIGVAKTGQVGG